MDEEQRTKWAMLASTGKTQGRYRIEFCPMLIDHMDKGLSYESFAKVAGVTVSTLKQWETLHPEWVQAKAEGFAGKLLFWERVMLGHVTGEVKANPAALIFALKNAFPEHYKDKQELDVKGYSNTVRLVDTGIVRTPIAPPQPMRPHTIEMERTQQQPEEEEEVDL